MCHALIIEDDYLVADYIAALAEISGATSTMIATSEKGAIKAAILKRPTIILCDIRLGGGCGLAATGSIRDSLGTIPVLYITGMPEDCPATLQASSILKKPFSRNAFMAAFQKLAAVG